VTPLSALTALQHLYLAGTWVKEVPSVLAQRLKDNLVR
jgi:hypothetical protein